MKATVLVELDEDLVIALRSLLDRSNESVRSHDPEAKDWTLRHLIRDLIWGEMRSMLRTYGLPTWVLRDDGEWEQVEVEEVTPVQLLKEAIGASRTVVKQLINLHRVVDPDAFKEWDAPR